MQTHNFCPKKSCLSQWTFSGSPGSMSDSFSSCSIAKQHSRANTGKQGSRDRGSPRKVSRSNVLTIFLCLTSYTHSVSLSDHCRMRWHVPHNRNSGETDWCEENSGFKNKGPQSWQRSPWMPVDPCRPPDVEMDSSAATGGGGRAHIAEDKSCSALTEDLCLLLKCHSCAFTQRGAKLCFGLEMNKILLSNSRLRKPTDTAFNKKPYRQPNALNKKIWQKRR